MGLFDQLGQVVGNALGGGAQANNPLLQAVVQQLRQSGGLAGLVQTLQKNGLADIVNSWVGTGANLPVSPQQIQQGLGSDLLKQLAAKAGISPEVAGSQLAALLPGLVDKLTPEGRIPDGKLLEQGLSLLKKSLG
jgi:uncharacterized protein YidB (DUF937 family)